jgi:WD40 repeat protein
MDWSDNERLIATGSNDKQIKLLVNPLLQESDPQNILELTLKGHRAKIRSLCFHPTNENVLLSGGNVDNEIMVWDTETGEKINTLAGHEGGTFCIKPSHYGTLFASIGKDKELKLWDLRNRDPLFCIDLAGYGEPDAIAINPEYTDTSISSAVVSHE